MRINWHIHIIKVTVFAILYVLGCGSELIASGKVDSCKAGLYDATSDTARIKWMIAIAHFSPCSDSTTYFRYLSQAIKLSQQISWHKGSQQAAFDLGNIYSYCENVKDYSKSVNWYKTSIKEAKLSGDTAAQLVTLQSLGIAFHKMTKFGEAIACYKEVLTIATDADTKIVALGNIGLTYSSVGDFPLALTYYDSSLTTLERLIKNEKHPNPSSLEQMGGLLITIADLYVNMSQSSKAIEQYKRVTDLGCEEDVQNTLNVWALMGIANTYQITGNYDTAINYYKKALNISKPSDFLNKALILNNLSNIYLETNLPTKAREHAEAALELATDYNFPDMLPVIYTTLGKVCNAEQKYQNASQYLQRAIQDFKKSGALDAEKDAWQVLSITYQHLQKNDSALYAYKKFIAIRDSVYNVQKANELTRIDLQADYKRQKEKATAENEQRIQRQKTLTYSGFAGLVLVLLLSFFIYRNYAFQKKANVIIKREKENAEHQRRRAERSEQFKQQFLANMSHEIRTPMNAVSGMTDLLLDKQPRPDQQKYLNVISKSSDILLHIINDILDLSKIEAGKLELEQIDFSLPDTLQQVRETLAIKSEEKGLQLFTTIDEKIPEVLVGDPFRLNQILINLGGNAIKFTDKGSVEIKVELLEINDGRAKTQFSITDTGAGIPEEKLDSLFKEFQQANASDTRKYGGTGLGLSISKQLVELQGGSIAVESKVGSGTTFSFQASFAQGSVERLTERQKGEQQADGSILNGLNILLADDNEYNRLVVTEALGLKSKVIIDEAANGEEAVQMMQTKAYDVVLMDVQMPIMNGLDATRFIRTKLPSPANNTPIIALTASMLRNDLDKCTDAGMNTYVPKPFKIWQLIAAIADLTGREGYAASDAENESPIATPDIQVPNAGVTDLTGLFKFCEGERDRVKKYIDIYLRAVQPFRNNILEAQKNKNIDDIATLVHTFKPKWMMMGMQNSTDIARKIEALCEEGDDEIAIYANLEKLLSQNEESVTELKSFV